MGTGVRDYGDKVEQIDDFFRRKREWSKVKDEIVGKYVTCYLRTIHGRKRPIIIVDGFAGPGRFGDDSEGSPLIMCGAVKRADVGALCLFADVHPAHRAALEVELKEFIDEGIAEKPREDFVEVLSRALELGSDATLFFYLDPYGIKDLEFETVRQIYDRNRKQSTEVLINFNFRTFMRMSGNWGYTDSAREVDRKIRGAKVEKVDSVMAGDYWRAIVTDETLTMIEREDKVIGAYVEKVREFFPYTYAIPVKELDESGHVPPDELAKYHLIFGTRSTRAVKYMNDVAWTALKPYFDQFKEGLLFPMTPTRYEPSSVEQVKTEIMAIVTARPQSREEIYEALTPKHFLQYHSKEYRAMIDDLVFKDKRLFRDPSSERQKNRLNKEAILATKPWPVERKS